MYNFMILGEDNNAIGIKVEIYIFRNKANET